MTECLFCPLSQESVEKEDIRFSEFPMAWIQVTVHQKYSNIKHKPIAVLQTEKREVLEPCAVRLERPKSQSPGAAGRCW